MSALASRLWNSIKSYFFSFSPQVQQRAKYFAFISVGSTITSLIILRTVSKLSGLKLHHLPAAIQLKYMTTRYNYSTKLANAKWKKSFPKALTRPSSEIMAVHDLFQLIQIFNLSRLNNNHSYYVWRVRILMKIIVTINPMHPSFVSAPKAIPEIRCMELNYPGCNAENGVILYIHGGAFIWGMN